MMVLVATTNTADMTLWDVQEIMAVLRDKEGLDPQMRVQDGNVAIAVPLPDDMLAKDLARLVRALTGVGFKVNTEVVFGD